MRDLSPTAQTILIIFMCFVVAINLSLLFAIRNRARTQPKSNTKRGKMPWESKTDSQAEELSRRVAGLRKEESPEKKEPPGDNPQP